MASPVHLRVPEVACQHALVAQPEHDHRDADGGTCHVCGSTLSGPDRDVRFAWPDALFADIQDGRTIDGLWMSHDSAASSVMMRARGTAFLRVLLPLRGDDGSTITYGVWLQLEVEDLHRAYSVWTEPEYVNLRLGGRLANDVPPGGVLDAPVTAAVRDPDETPYVDQSEHPLLNQLLSPDERHVGRSATRPTPP